ncbi:hypothetical protein D3C84_269530 [compost metagenome]
MSKMLKRFEFEEYMEGWMDNVGAPYGLRRAMMSAFKDKKSLRDWFGTDDVDYDEVHALKFMSDEYGDTYDD